MTLLMTLLTLFFGGNPTAAVPPEPERATATRPYEEVFATAITSEDPFGMPLLTLPKWHSSPSLMVAVPPAGFGTEIDVFSPAVRPPHEFPTLFPCAPVALVPCPAPSPFVEPPAIRHVGFTGEGAEFRMAQLQAQAHAEAEAGTCPLALDRVAGIHVADCQSQRGNACPPGFVFNPHLFGHPAYPVYGPLHVRHQAPQYHDPQAPHAGAVCEATGCPVMCPAEFCATSAGPGSPFPGAKSVTHIVSATYDVPHDTAKTVAHLLESGNGVQICSVNGDELTINATPQAQMAIAQFLANVVTGPKSGSRPQTTISVNHTEAKACATKCPEAKCTEVKACTTECSEAKACTTECSEAKCCKGACGEKCGCTCGKPKPTPGEPSASKTIKPGEIRFTVGIRDWETSPPDNSEWVAIVHGSPILASDVLEPYGKQLADAQKRFSPEKYQEIRATLIKRDLEKHIERKLMAEGLKTTLTKEEIAKVNSFIDQSFAKEVARMIKTLGVNTRQELEKELNKQHTSLANLKTNFSSQRMAMEWIGLQRNSCAEGQCSNDASDCKVHSVNTKPQTGERTTHNTLDKRVFSFFVGLADCNGLSDVKVCLPAPKPMAIDVQATETKPVVVSIKATPDGVHLWTSEGTHVRAQSIELETQGLGRLRFEQAKTLTTQPKPGAQPLSSASLDDLKRRIEKLESKASTKPVSAPFGITR